MAQLYPWQINPTASPRSVRGTVAPPAGFPGGVRPGAFLKTPEGSAAVGGDVAGRPVGSGIFNPTPSSTTGGTTPGSGSGAAGGGLPPFQFSSDLGVFSKLPGQVSKYNEPGFHNFPNEIAVGLKAMMRGETRFSPAVMEALKGKLLGTTEARKGVLADQIRDEAAMGGTYRSGQTGEDVTDALVSQDAAYTQGVRDIELQKVNADYEDKVAAFDRAQKYLDSSRAYALSVDANQIERDRLMSSLTLAYAKLKEDRESLEYDRWKTLLGREPIEGRDFIWGTGANGERTKIWLNALNAGNNLLGQG